RVVAGGLSKPLPLLLDRRPEPHRRGAARSLRSSGRDLRMRALRLYAISLLALAHRLRHDLARELVVLVCTLVLLATFLYVFNDFLNVQVSSLSTAMRARFADAALGGLLATAFAVGVKLVRDELYGNASLARMARRMGESPATLRAFLILRGAT